MGRPLDRRVPGGGALSGPYPVAERTGRDGLDAHEAAAQDPEAFAAPLPGREAVRRSADSGTEPLARPRALPGSGKQKARILLVLPGERGDVRPTGRRGAAAKAAKASKGSNDTKSDKSSGN
ncbi:hypothetical protein ABZ618_17880 [Streptomyces roseolus]|uniref:hypothetical protein n=1 Tax=Streptomyces roseolus TaxID=67358 RepID=UPI0033E9F9DE